MIKLRFSLILGGFAVFALSQAGSMYGTDTNGDIYIVDTATANATLLGNSGQFFESLAYHDSTGQLFGATGSGDLYSVSTVNGFGTFIGSTGLGNIEGLDFAGNFLYGFDFNSQPTIYDIDPTTAVANAFVQSDTVTGAVRTFCFDPTSTTALMAADAPSFQTLYGMTSSGVTTQIGSLNSEGTYGMDFVDGTMFGLGGGGQLWQIDPTTGAKTLVGSTGSQFWLGAAAIQSVPEPGTIAAIGLGLAALARRRRK